MKNQELIRSIRAEIAALRQKGHDAISLGNLDLYFEQLDKLTSGEPNQLDQLALQQLRTDLDVRLAQYKRAADEDLEMFRSVIAAGQTARHASMLINGGAAAALLAFVGHVVTSSNAKGIVPSLAFPLVLLLVGVLASAMSSGATYLAQAFWSKNRLVQGRVFNILAIVLVVASYFAFSVGCYAGFNVLRTYQP